MKTDERLMDRAIMLAQKNAGRTGFRPLVGCVIVKNGKIVGEGATASGGIPHAEAVALKQAGKRAFGATAFVNLEPCAWHEGKKAPACCEALVRAGIQEVFYSIDDPHPKISGRGAEFLKKAGVRVHSGLLHKEAAKQNAFWIKFASTGLPFVHLKMARSSDGFIWSPKIQQISGPSTTRLVHELRNTYSAIMVGVGTVLADDPRLTCRLPKGRDPLRVIIDPHLRSPLDAAVFKDGNCIVFAGKDIDSKKSAALGKKGIRVIRLNSARPNLKKVLLELAGLKISSVLLEGGRHLAQAFLDAGLVDKCTLVVSPKKLGEGVKAPVFSSIKFGKPARLGADLVFEGVPKPGHKLKRRLQAPRGRRS